MDRKGHIRKTADRQIKVIMVLLTVCALLLALTVYKGFQCAKKEEKVRDILMNLTGGNYTDYEQQIYWCQAWQSMNDPNYVFTKVYKPEFGNSEYEING